MRHEDAAYASEQWGRRQKTQRQIADALGLFNPSTVNTAISRFIKDHLGEAAASEYADERRTQALAAVEEYRKGGGEVRSIPEPILTGDPLDWPIVALRPMSVRLYGGLRGEECETVRDVTKLTEWRVRSMPNCGKKAFKELTELLAQHGLRLADAAPPVIAGSRREMALQEAGDAAADCVQRLERVKQWLDDLTPAEAQAWVRARQTCDFLYYAVNKP